MTLRGLAERAPRLLAPPGLPLAVVLLALLLVSPALGVGPMGDDYMHMARVDPHLRAPGFTYAPFDLFTFVSGDPAQRAVLLEEGVFGWWMAPDFRMSFWRPLSSLTHAVDHLLWPRSFAFAHAHSMLWFAALLAVLAALYRRFHVPWVAHLALLLYAVDDARGWVLGWAANRNALVAAALAFAALLAHDGARRDGWRPGTWVAPALFAAGLLGGEAALGVTGYLLAHALFVDSGPLVRRLGRLWPYATLSLAWLAAYKALGYGTSGGGMYLNPLDEPAADPGALAERLPVLAAAQVGLGLADAWLALPRAARLVAYSGSILTLVVLGAVLAGPWRRLPACRFWTLGAVLSLAPVCATYPMDRLLVFAGVGAMAAIALVLAEWIEGGFALLPRPRRILATGVALVLVLLHVVLAPVLLPLRVVAHGLSRQDRRPARGLDSRGRGGPGKSLIILSSAAEMTTFPPWMQRQVSGVPRPARRMRVLASCFSRVQVSRPDAVTLRVRPQNGFLDERVAAHRPRPLPAVPDGRRGRPFDVRARVRDVTADARPAEVDFTFGVPLEDPSLLWRRLKAGGVLVPWAPPAVGETQLLPSVAPRPAPTPAAFR